MRGAIWIALLVGLVGQPARGADLPHPLEVPPGFTVTVFAEGLPGVRMMAWSPQGHLTVSRPGQGEILVLPDRDHDGRADEVHLFARGLDRPHGLAWHAGRLWVASTGTVDSWQADPAGLRGLSARRVSEDLPAGGMHWTRTLAFDRAGRLYVSVGSSCNVCLEQDPRRAAILQLGADGRLRVHARGLRNAVGLRFHPRTGELWATENGRDWLGRDLPPDEVNRVRPGGDHGWPYAFGARVPDPACRDPARVARSVPAAVNLPAHHAPLGLEFYTGTMFPPAYRGDLFVACHGSWNRFPPDGYKILRIHMQGGQPAGITDFATGWLRGTQAWGRPVDVLTAPDGALMVTDDTGGRIYRISHR